jgi:peptide/nickel transport system permease protein
MRTERLSPASAPIAAAPATRSGPPLAAAARGPAGEGVSPGRMLLRRFLRHRLGVVSAGVLVLLSLACLAAPLVAALLGHDPNLVNLFGRFEGPSASHPLGTDELGRDLLLRLLYGGQVSLFVGLVGAIAASVLGTLIGVVAGYVGGRIDAVLMRLTDAVIALPLLPLLIVLAAVDLSKLGVPEELASSESASLYRILLIVVLAGWTTVARLVRGATLSVREHDFVRAAVALGARPVRIMVAHLLPNIASPIIVATTLSVGGVILIESTLSFLGLGIQPPLPSWGNMLSNAQELIWQAPQLAIYPGLLIFITVIAFNFVGDALQDAMDPRAHEP